MSNEVLKVGTGALRLTGFRCSRPSFTDIRPTLVSTWRWCAPARSTRPRVRCWRARSRWRYRGPKASPRPTAHGPLPHDRDVDGEGKSHRPVGRTPVALRNVPAPHEPRHRLHCGQKVHAAHGEVVPHADRRGRNDRAFDQVRRLELTKAHGQHPGRQARDCSEDLTESLGSARKREQDARGPPLPDDFQHRASPLAIVLVGMLPR